MLLVPESTEATCHFAMACFACIPPFVIYRSALLSRGINLFVHVIYTIVTALCAFLATRMPTQGITLMNKIYERTVLITVLNAALDQVVCGKTDLNRCRGLWLRQNSRFNYERNKSLWKSSKADDRACKCISKQIYVQRTG